MISPKRRPVDMGQFLIGRQLGRVERSIPELDYCCGRILDISQTARWKRMEEERVENEFNNYHLTSSPKITAGEVIEQPVIRRQRIAGKTSCGSIPRYRATIRVVGDGHGMNRRIWRWRLLRCRSKPLRGFRSKCQHFTIRKRLRATLRWRPIRSLGPQTRIGSRTSRQRPVQERNSQKYVARKYVSRRSHRSGNPNAHNGNGKLVYSACSAVTDTALLSSSAAIL